MSNMLRFFWETRYIYIFHATFHENSTLNREGFDSSLDSSFDSSFDSADLLTVKFPERSDSNRTYLKLSMEYLLVNIFKFIFSFIHSLSILKWNQHETGRLPP